MLASGLKFFFFLTFWGNHTILLHNVDFAPVASFIIQLASSAHLRRLIPENIEFLLYPVSAIVGKFHIKTVHDLG